MARVLASGSMLGGFEIVGPLGTGGMGQVYRAWDPRLRREVAIKLVSASLTGADAFQRFEQEARAAAALNHPNILTVHEIGVADGAPFVVSELLDGETLRARLDRGPLAPRTVVAYAVQILSGLAAAHEKGIVHRDLKPENLFITPDDRVKILDFGVAKLLQPAVSAGAETTLGSGGGQTTPGLVLGTVGYMSPEQVRGQPVDQRSDLFSLGVVVYEMLAGVRPFSGQSPADVISAILHDEPADLSVVTSGRVPPALDRCVRHALEKEPGRRRFQSARDMLFALDALSGTFAAPPPSPSRRSSSRNPAALAIAAALGIACGAMAVWLLGPGFRDSTAGAQVVQRVERLTHDHGSSEWPTWSPDGRMFAFSSNRNGNFDIFLAPVGGGGDVRNITQHASDNVQPAFSPDGTSIAFVSTRASERPLTKIGNYATRSFRTFGGDVWVMPAPGGAARRVAADGNFPVWHPDGRSIAYVSGEETHRTILSVPADGGSPRTILPAGASSWEIVRLSYTPNGRWLTFETADTQLMVMPADGGEPTELLRVRGHAWAGSAQRVYYLRPEGITSEIHAADIEEGRHGLTVASVRTVGTNTGPIQHLAVAPGDQHLLVADMQESLNLTRLALSPAGETLDGTEVVLNPGQVRDRYPAVSPSSRRVLFGSNRFGLQELWTIDLESAHSQRVELPRTGYDGVTGCWFRDDRHVIVMTVAAGMNAYWLVALDGSSTEQLVPPAAGGPGVQSGSFACAMSPGGTTLLYQRLVGSFTQLVLLDIASKRERPLTTSASHKYDATWSPDGRWVAFATNSDGGVNVWRIPAGGGEEQPLTSGRERIRHFFYSPDSRWLYLQPNHRNIYRMPAAGGARHAVTRFPETSSLFIEEPTISPDGRFLVYCRDRGGSSIWLFSLTGGRHDGR